jgi:tellurite resistance protein TerC
MQTASSRNFLQKLNHALRLDDLPPGARRWLIGIVGGTILLIGLALVILPGPAFIVIPLGLAILASEFAWAKRYLDKAHGLIKKVRRKKEKRTAK